VKKLLLILTTLTCAHSLQSMDPTSLYELRRTGVETPTTNLDDMKVEIPKKLSPISLPQIYSHLAKILLPEIAKHIFSLQPGSDTIHNKLCLKKEDSSYCLVAALTTCMEIVINKFGHCFSVELLKRSLFHEKVSICNITNGFDDKTVLHMTAKNGYSITTNDRCTKTAKVFLEIDKNLLLTQNNKKQTALHIAAKKSNCELVELFLKSAGNNALTLINIKNHKGKTAFDVAMPDIKAIMLPYLQNNQ
jgi:hypothetical protein